MHIALAVIAALATLLFAASRLAASSRDLADSAERLANIPRKRRFQKQAGKTGLALVKDPLEAVAVLMVCFARVEGGDYIRLDDEDRITDIMEKCFELEPHEATNKITLAKHLSRDIVQPHSAILPMGKVIKPHFNREERLAVLDLLRLIAGEGAELSERQEQFLSTVKYRFNLHRPKPRDDYFV